MARSRIPCGSASRRCWSSAARRCRTSRNASRRSPAACTLCRPPCTAWSRRPDRLGRRIPRAGGKQWLSVATIPSLTHRLQVATTTLGISSASCATPSALRRTRSSASSSARRPARRHRAVSRRRRTSSQACGGSPVTLCRTTACSSSSQVMGRRCPCSGSLAHTRAASSRLTSQRTCQDTFSRLSGRRPAARSCSRRRRERRIGW
mmetsp:Transcript_36072/g.116628  ORF Transcript_36072/g.116628 Transcript_36072/m.116628 type:complete len:206 (-) Transcript_36072:689-1306(-)